MELYKIRQKLFLFAEIVLNNTEELIISSLKGVRISADEDIIQHPRLCSCLKELPYLHLCVCYTARSFKLAFPPLFSDGRLRLHWCDLLVPILQQCLVCCTASGTDQ